MNKQSMVICLAMAAISLTGILASNVSSAEPDKKKKFSIETVIEKRQMAMEKLTQKKGKKTVEMCVDKYTTTWVEEGKVPHIAYGDQFILVGPNPVSGIWQVTPKGKDHQWEHGHYQAIPSPNPDVFYIWNAKVKQHDPAADRVHLYTMAFDTMGEDDCPDRIVFEATAHIQDGYGHVDLDPGHAGVER